MSESTARVERVNLQSVSSPAFTWEAPEKPISVRVPFALIDRMEREVVENFRSLTSRGSEIGGILLGAIVPGSRNTLFIDDYEVIPCDYSRGPLYRLSDADMGRFERAIEQNQAAGGMKVVGFFRSHTRKGLSLDSEDLSFFSARFRDPSNVALLVRPFANKASTAGFFIWENGAVQGESSSLEFPFRSSQLAPSRQGAPPFDPPPANPAISPAASSTLMPASPKPVMRAQIVPIASRREITLPVAPEPVKADPPAASAPSPVVAPAPEKEEEVKTKAPAKEAAPEPEKAKQPDKPKEAATAPAPPKRGAAPVEVTPEPELPQTGGRGKSIMIVAIAAAALLACTVLFLYPGVLRHGGGTAQSAVDTSSLALRVERTGTDILLTWNRDSAAIQHASHAVLSISDGERQENYDMDLGQLRNGSIVYSPLTADVSFRMEVTEQNKAKHASESVRVLRTRPSPMPDGSEPAPVEAAKANGKSAAPASPASPVAAADDSASQEAQTPAKVYTPSKPFNTESLAQRLRPATSTEIALPNPRR